MIKVKDFFNYLCEKLNYRFFSGVATEGLKILYDNMDPEKMHYIPAVDESVALGLVSGAYINGHKGAVILNYMNFLDLMLQYEKFNTKNNIHTLFIIDADVDTLFNKCVLKDDLCILDSISIKSPTVLIIEKGVLYE